MVRAFFYKVSIAFIVFLGLICQANALEIDDVSGSADHPNLNRIAGSKIVAFAQSDYGGNEFLTGYENRKFITTFKEGKRTRLVYALKEGQTGLFALRNYQQALAELGDVSELYACRENGCPREIGSQFVWGKNKGVPTAVKTLHQMYQITSYHKGSVYWSGEVQSKTGHYTVSLYSASAAPRSINHKKLMQGEGFAIDQVFLHLDIIEKAAFKSDLEVVQASEIQKSIAAKGHVALYGLFFDTGKDQLTDQSKPALIEIAKALNAESNLNVYVVGHTDNVGSLQSNQSLSERRAASIINSLVSELNVQASRLIPIGVGLAAPVASNDTEEGRSLNRRVELVKR